MRWREVARHGVAGLQSAAGAAGHHRLRL